ncbi:MAG: oxidoreductase [Promicromonosporaceae bacterium]|nr:oxidoreductase [Promicromonosporaceae bacterium]
MSARLTDLSGRTAVVTGGSRGIGRAVAAVLAERGAHVVLAVRDQEQGRAAALAMPGDVEVRPLDLGSLASVRAFADGLPGPVDLLVNNAGTMSPTRQQTADGFERQLGVNHLGPFALTNLLLDRLTGRVVSVTSNAHRGARIDFDDLQWEQRPYTPFGAYGQSKLAVLLFTAGLRRRLAAAGSPVLATAADPGWAATDFTVPTGNRAGDVAFRLGTRLLAQSPAGGARPTLLAAVGDVPSGGLAAPRWFGVRGDATVVAPAPGASDPAVAARLWAASEELTGVRFPQASR